MLFHQKFIRNLPSFLLASVLIGSLTWDEVQSNQLTDHASTKEETILSRQFEEQVLPALQRKDFLNYLDDDGSLNRLSERAPRRHHRKYAKHGRYASKGKHDKHRHRPSKPKKKKKPQSESSTDHQNKHPAASVDYDQDNVSDYSHPTQSKQSSNRNKPSLTPNGNKAGIAGGQSLPFIKSAISWVTEWTPNPYGPLGSGNVVFATMMWGVGRTGHDKDAQRFEEFKKVPHGKYKYVIGMNEADFEGVGSSGYIDPGVAAQAWDTYIAPHGEAGSLLISPSCAKQQDENWMGPFLKKVKTKPDIINVHIFKNKASEIKTVLDHYAKYGYPMWVSELACIDYSDGRHDHCSQEQAEEFVREAVKILEADDRVKAYAWSDADNGPACQLTKEGGKILSATGQVLKNVFSAFAKRDLDES